MKTLANATLAVLLSMGTACAQPPTAPLPPTVEWIELDKALETAPAAGKHIMIDVYTDWCGYCKKLDAETYSEAGVRKILAESYLSVKLKGDSGKKMRVTGQALQESGKTLLQFVTTDSATTSEQSVARGALRVRGFPTIAFLSPDGRLITKFDGFLNAEQFTNMINYIKDDLYEVMTFSEYLQSLENKEKEKM